MVSDKLILIKEIELILMVEDKIEELDTLQKGRAYHCQNESTKQKLNLLEPQERVIEIPEATVHAIQHRDK